MTTTEQNRNGNHCVLNGRTTCYCTDEFRSRWNTGDVDLDWDSLWVVLPSTSRGLPTNWEGSAAAAIEEGLMQPSEFENVGIDPAPRRNFRTPTLTDSRRVEQYANQVMEMRAMIANLVEYLDTMPAPNEDGDVPGLCDADVSDLDAMHGHLLAASEIADELSE